MNKRQQVIRLYKGVKDLEIKNKLLRFLINGKINLFLSDIDYQVETLLEKYLRPHYNFNFTAVTFEL